MKILSATFLFSVTALTFLTHAHAQVKTPETSMVGFRLSTSQKSAASSSLQLSSLPLKAPLTFSLARTVPQACTNYEIFNSLSPLEGLSSEWYKINTKYSERSCFNARLELTSDRFSISRCTDVYNCSMKRFADLGNAEKRNRAYALIRNAAAKELAANMLKAKAKEMEDLEILKKFAAEKYKVKAHEKCGPIFNVPVVSSCQMGIVEAGFREVQDKNCKSSSKKGCALIKAGDELQSFGVFLNKNKSENGSGLIKFFETRTIGLTDNFVSNDQKYIDTLADLIDSEKFKKASAAEKENLFIDALKSKAQLKHWEHRDPILAHDFNLSDSGHDKFKSEPQYRKLKAIILEKNLDKNAFVSKFENYRKERAEQILGQGGSCDRTPTISSICKSVTDVNKGHRIHEDVDSMALAQLLSERHFDEEGPEYRAIKELLGDSLKDEKDFNMFLDAQRCHTFSRINYTGSDSDNVASQTQRGDDSKERGAFSNFGSPSSPRNEYNEDDVAPLISSSAIRSSGSGLMGGSTAEEDQEEGSVTEKFADIEELKEDPNQGYFANNNNYYNQNNAYNPAYNPDIREDSDNSGQSDKAEEKKSEETAGHTETAAQNESRISELMKKLSATEEKLEKLKSSTEAAEEARVREKKIAEETALISELKSQINELKEANKAKPAQIAQGPVQRQDFDQLQQQSYQPAFGSSASIRSQEKAQSITHDVVEQNRIKEAAGGNSSGGPAQASRSIASAPVLSTMTSDNGEASVTYPVLTQVDGMSAEKASETIVSKLLELEGKPFIIKENGVFMKVVAESVNGELVFEKGVPKYRKVKCDEKLVCEDSARKPAYVSVADEKRQEEEKTKREIDRAKYRLFQEASQKAMQKKK